MNPADIVIILLLAAALGFALRQIIKKKGGCSCGCGSCSGNCGACQSACKKRKNTDPPCSGNGADRGRRKQ